MEILFTSSKNPVDWLIAKMTNEDCAHMAILFESYPGSGVVFESNLLGCHPAFFQTWMGKKRTIVHKKVITLTKEQEDQVWDRWVTLFDGHEYDFGGAIYLGFAKLVHRLFNRPLPQRNRWAKAQAFFCDEVYQVLKDLPGCPDIDQRSNGMDSPHDVWEKIK